MGQSCWRQRDVARILSGNDSEMIGAVGRFCLFNEESASLERTSILRKMERWQWTICTRNTSGDLIGYRLAEESHRLFRLVPFEEWVQEAQEWSPLPPRVIRSFRSQIETLSKLVFDYLRACADQHAKYLQVIGTLQHANPFAHAAVGNACYCLAAGAYSNHCLKLDFRFITDPLRQLLHEQLPVPVILRRLEALAVRFRNRYHSADVDWSQQLDINTTLLSKLLQKSPMSIALQISEGDRCQFQGLQDQIVTAVDNNTPLSSLNFRWNNLCQTVGECAAAGNGIRLKMTQFAQALHNLRNFYSLTAVLQGLDRAGFSPSALRDLHYLIEHDNNYQSYRDDMDESPALHFLFPVMKDVRHGKLSSFLTAVDTSSRYRVRKMRLFQHFANRF